MDGSFLDHREFDVTPDHMNKVLKETDWLAYCTWWNEKELPVGLQLVNVHCHPTTREFCELICEENDIKDPSIDDLIKMAITVDSMIS